MTLDEKLREDVFQTVRRYYDECVRPLAEFAPGELPCTDAIMERSFWLGVYPGVNDEMVAYMLDKIREAVAGKPLRTRTA